MIFRFPYRWAPRFRFLPQLVAVMLIIVAAGLGKWQLQRAHEKIERTARIAVFEQLTPQGIGTEKIETASVESHRVFVQGNFISEATILLDNRPHANGRDSRTGFVVITPLRIKGPEPRYVLIKRGWLPRDPYQRTHIPSFRTPSGNVDIEGIVKANVERVFEFQKIGEKEEASVGVVADQQSLPIRQNLEIAEVGQQQGWPMQPFVIEQYSLENDGLARDWPPEASGAERHYGYAFQWFALAALVLALTLFFSLLQRSPDVEHCITSMTRK